MLQYYNLKDIIMHGDVILSSVIYISNKVRYLEKEES